MIKPAMANVQCETYGAGLSLMRDADLLDILCEMIYAKRVFTNYHVTTLERRYIGMLNISGHSQSPRRQGSGLS